jgi:pimeloyl-ACP methyl ester carboxylesterase
VRVDEHTISFDQTPVFYRSAASMGVPTLYVHGIPTSSDDWTAFLERTGGLAPDLPGFGRSGKAGNLEYTIGGHADFLERFLDQLQVRRVSLVAHDWGAGGGLVFAQRNPDRVQRLVLCNALPLLEGFRWHRLGRALRTPLLGELLMGSVTRRLLARELRRGCASPDLFSDAALAAIWEQFDQGTQRAILRLYRSAPESALATAGASLAAVRAPALIVWGELDPWFDAMLADAYGARLPAAEVVRIQQAGHWPWLEDPSIVERVAAFVGPGVAGAAVDPGATGR